MSRRRLPDGRSSSRSATRNSSSTTASMTRARRPSSDIEIHAGGMKDGEEVLDILARDPHTAHHISFELAQRFVSDNPPDALVDRMAQTFLKTDGDIREVLHTMIYSPEFWSKDVYRAKIKTPFELVVSATRAVGAEVDVPLMLVQWTNRIGQPLYQCEPPTGYSDKADAWVNTGALLNRMNFSLALTANRLRGAQVDMDSLLGSQRCDGSATRCSTARSRCSWAARCRRKRATRSKSN